MLFFYFFFFKQKTAYEMRISDWSSDVCSSDLRSSFFVPSTAGVYPWRRGRRDCRSPRLGGSARSRRGAVVCRCGCHPYAPATRPGRCFRLSVVRPSLRGRRLLYGSSDVGSRCSLGWVASRLRSEERRGGKGGGSTC